MRPDLFLIPHFGGLIKPLSCHLVRQILLLYIMVREGMGVEIPGSPSQIGGAFVVGVLKMRRDGADLLGFYGMALLMAITAELLLGAQAT